MALANYSGDTTQGSAVGDLNPDASHLDVFIPELWSDGIYRYFEKNLVLKPFFDDYSSMAQGRGALNIDQHTYAAKLFEDIAMIQANEQLFDKYAQSMAYALSKAVDTEIESKLQGLGTTQSLAADNSMSNADVETALGTLMSNDVPRDECAFIVNPLIFADLLNSRAFVAAGGNIGGAGAAGIGFGADNDAMSRGEIGSLFGIPVFTSSLVSSATGTGTHAGYLVHKSAIAVAVQQDIRIQSEYSVDFLGTKVVADIIYGCVATTSNHVKGIEFLNP